MNAYTERIGPAGAGEPALACGAVYPAFAWSVENELERLKNRLLREALRSEPSSLVIAPLRRAANESAAIAWLEPHPLLVFAELFAEFAAKAKSRSVKRRAARTPAFALLQEAA